MAKSSHEIRCRSKKKSRYNLNCPRPGDDYGISGIKREIALLMVLADSGVGPVLLSNSSAVFLPSQLARSSRLTNVYRFAITGALVAVYAILFFRGWVGFIFST